MATVTGQNLLSGILNAQSTNLSAALQNALAARLQKAIDAGLDTNFQIAAILAGNLQIRTSLPAGQAPLTVLPGVIGSVRNTIENDVGPGPGPADPNAHSTVHTGTAPLPNTATPYVPALLSEHTWGSGKTILTYSFNATIPPEYNTAPSEYTLGWQPLNNTEKTAVRSNFAELGQLLNIGFTEVASGGDIRFNAVATVGNTAGFAIYPGQHPISGDVWLDISKRQEPGSYDPGGFGRLTIAHEIGHALGLKHTFDHPALPLAIDTRDYTVMSYTDGRSLQPIFTYDNNFARVNFGDVLRSSYSVLDVAALQTRYGANTATRTGDDIYIVRFDQYTYHTLWDAGGADTIDASTATGASRVDLRPGTYSSIDVRTLAQQEADANAYYQSIGQGWAKDFVHGVFTGQHAASIYTGENNLGIAHGVWIENLRTGSGNDTIYDNAVNNRIAAGAGNDTIHLGAGGYDWVDGGAGTDTAVFGVSQHTVQRTALNDGSTLLIGGHFAVQLIGVEWLQFSDALLAA